ncbi:MAG TPA: hypothetical protein VNZ53_22425 [Steroidobacteraceae bacterium]|nr:hypothetical protein [Steroidobacteraceae bacterium]
MRLVVGFLAMIGAGALAVADPPAQTPTQSAASAASPASPATPPTAAAGAPHETAAAIDPREKMLKARGYHLEMRNGEKYYCRSEEVMGSRLGGRKYCGTVADVEDREHRSKDMAEGAQRQQLNPTGK